MDYKNLIKKNLLTILFAFTVIISLFFTDLLEITIIERILLHVMGYLLITIALIVPIRMGMGFNFGIGIGGIAAQFALIFALNFALTGILGFIAVVIFSTILAVCFGYLHGLLLNRAKGHEMITSLFVGYSANGIYQFIVMFIIGSIIPFKTTELLLSTGTGLRNTIDLSEFMGKTHEIPLFVILLIVSIHFTRTNIKEYIKQKSKLTIVKLIVSSLSVLFCCIVMFTNLLPQRWNLLKHIEFSLISFVSIIAVIISYEYFIKDKLKSFSTSSSKKARILTIVLSTVIAAWGQLILLYDKGMFITYSAHRSALMFAIPALIIGGASLKHATVKNGIIGLILTQAFYLITLPLFEGNIASIIQMIVLNCVYVYCFVKKYSQTKLKGEIK